MIGKVQTPDEVVARIEALSPADRAEVSPDWLARVHAATPGDPWVVGFSVCTIETCFSRRPIMTFRAKKDVWLVCMLVSFVVTFAALGVFLIVMSAGEPVEIGAGVLAVAVALFFLRGLRTTYEITPSHIVIRGGVLRWRIPVDAVVAVTPTSQRSLLLGGTHLRLALSADALMIRYRKPSGKKWLGLIEPAVLISPEDRTGFMRALAQAVPDLESSDEGGLCRRQEIAV